MSRYITLGADRNGEVYGLEVNDDGTLRRNPLGCSTSCAVIRPVTKENYEYLTEDPQSVKEQWQQAVQADQTEKGLDDWFKEIDAEELMDKSFVYELLEDDDNPTVKAWGSAQPVESEVDFRDHVSDALINSAGVEGVESEDDVYEWESSGWFPPREPFAVEFAPKAVLDEYYAHLRETYKEFKG
jgi:hypothetical protein